MHKGGLSNSKWGIRKEFLEQVSFKLGPNEWVEFFPLRRIPVKQKKENVETELWKYIMCVRKGFPEGWESVLPDKSGKVGWD